VATVVDTVAGAETIPINVNIIYMVATTLVAMDVATMVIVRGTAHNNSSMVATSLPVRCVEKLATLP
jgi:hypothetical protein